MSEERLREGAPEQIPAPPQPPGAERSPPLAREPARASEASATPAAEPSSEDLPARPGESLTEGGYAYTVVDDAAPMPPPSAKREAAPLRIAWPLLVALVVVPAVVVGALAWILASRLDGGGSGDTRTDANVANTINAFSSGQGGRIQRYEGVVPPGLPKDIPVHPGAKVVSALAQVNGNDVVYLVVYDTPDSLEEVVDSYDGLLGNDPWQIDGGQNARDSSLRQFTKIDDPAIAGLVVILDSKRSDVTTIILSAQVTSGAADADLDAFQPPVSGTLPQGFPDKIARPPDAIIIETSFTRASRATTYGVSIITRDNVSSVLDFYRGSFTDAGWSVTDGNAGDSTLKGAKAITFNNEDSTISGGVTAGEFAEDANYTRIDLVVQNTAADNGGS